MAAPESSVIVEGGDPLIGRSIGAYVVKSQLGDGGMAVVYLAEHQAIGRKMAVKVLKAEVAAQSEWGQRFVAEAQVVAALKHRNIVEVFDFGQLADGRQFLMMEYVQGESLATYVEQHAPLIPAVALDFADQILNGLGEAHKKGIVHRDLKPGNVMLVREHNNEPLLKVLDFGLARQGALVLALEPGSQDAKTSLLAGTPAYVAPEQALGEVVDGRADLYALGVMLFEMISGRLPFNARDDRDLVQMHVANRPPALDEVVQNLPEGLSDFVANLLSKDRESRPANADVARQMAQRIIKRLRVDATNVRSVAPAGQARVVTQKMEPTPAPSTDLSLAAVRPTRGPRAALVVAAVALVALAVWAFWPTAVVPVVQPPEPTPRVEVVPPVEPVAEVDAGTVAVAVVPPEDPTPLPLLPTPKPEVRKPTPVAKCTFDDRFRDYARRTRDELRGMKGANGDEFKGAADRLSDALVERNCAKANTALSALHKAVGITED